MSLEAASLTVEVFGKTLLESASFRLARGDKVGLVGANGAGKTSLLRVLAAERDPRSGRVEVQGRLAYMPQDPKPAGDDTELALYRVLSGRGLDKAAVRLERLRQSLEADPTLEAVERYSKAEESFRLQGGYFADGEVRRILIGLGLAPERVDAPLAQLSGGERRRVEMARLLFSDPQVLLLDEPTNHLDSQAKSWLMDFLRSFPAPLMVVSHDLELLDSAITRVLHLEGARLIEYRGTYSKYLKAREADQKRRAREAEHQAGEIKRLTTLAAVMRTQTAKRAKTAHALDKRVERLRKEQVAAPVKSSRIKVRLPDPPHSGRVVLRCTGLGQSYGGPFVFRNLSFQLERGERLLVMGLNGAGKTSLLRVLAGRTAAATGSVSSGHGVLAGYYAQEHEGITAGRDLLSHMREHSDLPEPVLRSILGMMGLTGKKAMQAADTLSGGEKARLVLAQLIAGRYNLLILDEPTNNLDPQSREAVAEALASWPGSIVLVSHDPEFVRAIAPDRALLMPEGELQWWNDDHLELVAMA